MLHLPSPDGVDIFRTLYFWQPIEPSLWQEMHRVLASNNVATYLMKEITVVLYMPRLVVNYWSCSCRNQRIRGSNEEF